MPPKKKKKNMGSAVNKIDIKAAAKRTKASSRRANEAERRADFYPTQERTRSAASTSGRTRSERSGSYRDSSKPGRFNDPSREPDMTVGFYLPASLPKFVKDHIPGGKNFAKNATRQHDSIKMMDALPSSGAGRGTSPRYEGTPYTAETVHETLPSPPPR